MFRGRHAGEAVVVLGAGGSLNYLRPRVLAGRFPIVAVNSAARVWGIRPSYVVCKEHVEEAPPNAAAFPDVPILVSRGAYGNAADGWPTFPEPNIVVYDHRPNRAAEFDVYRDFPTDPDQLVVSMSTITTAMHFAAAILGAKVVFVVGHDVGTVGDESHVHGYGHPADPGGGQPDWMPGWLAQIEKQSLAVRRELERRFDCDVVGITPWITPNLDGLSYVGGSNHINHWGG